MKRKNALMLAGIWLLVMVGVVASTVTLLASGGSIGSGRWVSREEYEMIERYSQLDQIRENLIEDYYQEIDEEILLTGAKRGMMDALEDPYTFYYTPEEMKIHEAENSGDYVGIGLLVQRNAEGYIEVLRVYEGSPADLGGVLAGDLIIKVDGRPVSGDYSQSANETFSMINGEPGTNVDITILRADATLDIQLTRSEVNISNITSEILQDDIGYINIFQFSGDVVPAFKEALKNIQKANAEGLIIDLRNNPGGLLDEVVKIADLLLPEGNVVYIEYRAGSREDFYSDSDFCDLPLVVLVNEMSASSSEILAAAIQDHERGLIVGTQTYGKGIVQTLVHFEEDGAGMQYTSACYYTPDGKNIHGTGVTPDILAEAENGYVSYSGIPDLENDAQLKQALEIIKNEKGRKK